MSSPPVRWPAGTTGYTVKLVRDRVEEALGGHGTITYERVASHDEHVERLRKKLHEEALEYIFDPSIGELGDSLGAILNLAHIDLGIPKDDALAAVVAAMERKAAERGGFELGTVMVCHHPADAHNRDQRDR